MIDGDFLNPQEDMAIINIVLHPDSGILVFLIGITSDIAGLGNDFHLGILVHKGPALVGYHWNPPVLRNLPFSNQSDTDSGHFNKITTAQGAVVALSRKYHE